MKATTHTLSTGDHEWGAGAKIPDIGSVLGSNSGNLNYILHFSIYSLSGKSAQKFSMTKRIREKLHRYLFGASML